MSLVCLGSRYLDHISLRRAFHYHANYGCWTPRALTYAQTKPSRNNELLCGDHTFLVAIPVPFKAREENFTMRGGSAFDPEWVPQKLEVCKLWFLIGLLFQVQPQESVVTPILSLAAKFSTEGQTVAGRPFQVQTVTRLGRFAESRAAITGLPS